MTYNQLITKVKDVLSAGSTGIVQFYTSFPDSFEKYPCCIITPLGHKNQIASLRDNVRLYSLLIRIVGNLEGETTDTQTKVRDIVDSVINVLEKQSNLSLDGIIDWSDATEATFRFQDQPTRLYIAEITYQIRARFNRWT